MDLFIEFFIELFINFPTFTIFQEKDDMTIIPEPFHIRDRLAGH